MLSIHLKIFFINRRMFVIQGFSLLSTMGCLERNTEKQDFIDFSIYVLMLWTFVRDLLSHMNTCLSCSLRKQSVLSLYTDQPELRDRSRCIMSDLYLVCKRWESVFMLFTKIHSRLVNNAAPSVEIQPWAFLSLAVWVSREFAYEPVLFRWFVSILQIGVFKHAWLDFLQW